MEQRSPYNLLATPDWCNSATNKDVMQTELVVPAPLATNTVTSPLLSHRFQTLPTPFYSTPNASLYQGDSLELLKDFESETFDLVFADPPYFLSNNGVTCHNGKMVSVNKGAWDRSAGIDEDHEFHLQWLEQCQRILKPNGTLWVSGTHHVIFSVGFAMQKLGYKVLNQITWFKVNPPPNLSCRYFTHGTETIIWAAKNARARHLFNYQEMKADNGDKQMRDLWNIMSPRTAEKTHGKHPTQKPVKLLDRIVRASTTDGALILDPFAGSSTTGVAALQNNRLYVGIEQKQEYLELSKKRLHELA